LHNCIFCSTPATRPDHLIGKRAGGAVEHPAEKRRLIEQPDLIRVRDRGNPALRKKSNQLGNRMTVERKSNARREIANARAGQRHRRMWWGRT